eukprot:2478866-Pleurochrysis_carterae.AAC.1
MYMSLQPRQHFQGNNWIVHICEMIPKSLRHPELSKPHHRIRYISAPETTPQASDREGTPYTNSTEEARPILPGNEAWRMDRIKLGGEKDPGRPQSPTRRKHAGDNGIVHITQWAWKGENTLQVRHAEQTGNGRRNKAFALQYLQTGRSLDIDGWNGLVERAYQPHLQTDRHSSLSCPK